MRVLLSMWAAVTVMIGGWLTALHALPLESQRAWSTPGSGRWSAVHVLDLKCPCSRAVLDRVRARGARHDITEVVALIHGKPEVQQSLEAAGFAVENVAPEQLEPELGVTAAPVLVVRAPDGTPRYVGAYAARRTRPPEDMGLIDAALAGHPAAPFPLFGCAVSRALQQRLDPLHLKYPL